MTQPTWNWLFAANSRWRRWTSICATQPPQKRLTCWAVESLAHLNFPPQKTTGSVSAPGVDVDTANFSQSYPLSLGIYGQGCIAYNASLSRGDSHHGQRRTRDRVHRNQACAVDVHQASGV